MQPLIEDRWLAGVLERPVWRVATGPEDPALAPALTEAGPGFFWGKLDCDRCGDPERMAALGFRLLDVAITLGRMAEDRDRPTLVRPAGPADADAVTRIAGRSFTQSRFHRDPDLPAWAGGRIKEAWVREWFAGRRGTAMLVAEHGAELAGFILLLEDEAGLLIDLIAVDPGHQRRGVGAALLTAAEAAVAPGTPIRVGTQVLNRAAIRVYESCGYRLTGASYVFHRHQA